MAILSRVFGVTSANPPERHVFGKNSVVFQLAPAEEQDIPRFVAVFRFGSVVFVNMSAREAGRILENIKLHG